MSGLLNVSSSPHVRSKDTTEKIMRYVFIALMPASIFGIYNFGINALIVIAVTVAASVLTEYLYEKAMHKPNTISDWSAAVTGLLLALNLPCPYGTENVIRMCLLGILGSVFAIIIVKQLFGGLGQNFMNPALGARCFLLISFTGRMTSFTYDGITGATPLALLKAGESVNVLDMVIGRIPGTIGETSVIAIVIGAIFLIWMDVIDLRIPGTYIVTFAIFALLFGGHGFDLNYVCAELAGGGLMLGAFFMATDYVTSPITKKGQIVYGIILGCLTGLFRIFGGSAEGVSYAIIFSNLLVPLIERLTIPKAFGKGGEK
ncbi:RnfABCDGE type electron transport complex subunit D [Oscillospiraceae bacterium Marseille-Q3528]|nr:RnfABCDGE type electron transport complex subunit D [Oscillospiraceae bacterium Marseille-Q3528]WNV56687.1 RnfABCDGE type electron transport complex subunit D [Oscillospiraceae bacterium NTUH-002-81]